MKYNSVMNAEYLKNFKDGVSDALLFGNMAEEYDQVIDGYKAGYDFGMDVIVGWNMGRKSRK